MIFWQIAVNILCLLQHGHQRPFHILVVFNDLEQLGFLFRGALEGHGSHLFFHVCKILRKFVRYFFRLCLIGQYGYAEFYIAIILLFFQKFQCFLKILRILTFSQISQK